MTTALVVGGGSGIGEACAAALADHGHRAKTVDVRDEAGVRDLFAELEADPSGPVSVLVHCAGISGFRDRRPSLGETTVESWEEVFAVNARGPFLTLREMVRRRTERPVEHARAILIGSSAAQDGGRTSPPAYVASKGAVHALARAAVREAAAIGMTVNTVAPGAVDTPLLRAVLPAEAQAAAFAPTPLGRAGLPAEVAAAVAFLASPDASFLTGTCVDVNGGTRLA